MTKRWGIPALLLVFCGCSDSTAPPNTPIDTPISFTPREVPFVTVGHGTEPGEAEVSWWIVSWATFPIAEYRVAFSHEGPITEANWNEADILGTYPQRKGQVLYREVFGGSDGLSQGATIWIAVRARDTQGNLSSLKESPRLTLSTEWWIEGHVLDLSGAPIHEAVVISTFTGRTAISDMAGFYRAGPFRSIDFIIMETDGTTPGGSWYGYTRKPVRTLPGRALLDGQDFILFSRHTLDPDCVIPDPDFLTYLRHMSLTTTINNDPRTNILHRWDQYPIKVFIPTAVNDDGVRMDEAALIALLLWNNALGEEYFVRTEQIDDADIDFVFEEMTNFYGLVSLVLPAGPGTDLGRVVPEKMAISINPRLPSANQVAGVSLHELGHSLGLYTHPKCEVPDYLMRTAGGLGALDRSEPIHPDELRAIKCIRYLPQGQDMSLYHPVKVPGP